MSFREKRDFFSKGKGAKEQNPQQEWLQGPLHGAAHEAGIKTLFLHIPKRRVGLWGSKQDTEGHGATSVLQPGWVRGGEKDPLSPSFHHPWTPTTPCISHGWESHGWESHSYGSWEVRHQPQAHPHIPHVSSACRHKVISQSLGS